MPQKPPQSRGQVSGSFDSQIWLPHEDRLQSSGQLKRVSLSSQIMLPQKPGFWQSMGQLSGDSNGSSHTRLPQVAGERQSKGQVNGVSPGSQRPLPHVVGVRQSDGQLSDVSPGSQSPLPQNVMLQSIGQLKVLSPISQIRFPQLGMQNGGGTGPPGSETHGPQSLGQLSEFSPGSHRPLPHTTPTGQSRGHEAEVSVEAQMESPQKPQSCGQLEMVSGGAQTRLPQ